jgi:predicted dehydrogenase
VTSVGIGVLGGRSFIASAALLPAIDAADGAHLAAIAARSGPVDERWSHAEVGGYEDVIGHPDVDVVYVPLPNGQHRRWVEAAADAGKQVLCEKPLAASAHEAEAMAEHCRRAGVLLAEAWMTPFAPRWAEVIRQANDGELGEISHIDSAFTFTIGPGNEDNYRWDPAEGGGALLDVGIYALGPAVALWGPEAERVVATARLSDRGVDVTTSGELWWGSNRRATFRVSFAEEERQVLEIVGSEATLRLDTEAHTGDPAATEIIHIRAGVTTIERIQGADPYRRMVESLVRSVRDRDPWPRPATESVALLRLLDRVRNSTRMDRP